MKILILGGTGCIGEALVDILRDSLHEVYITSRKLRTNYANIHYIYGNAKEIEFLREVLTKRYDAIVDFMHYIPSEFEGIVDLFLKSTKHYIFLSSARVYSDAGMNLINEKSNRLIDLGNSNNNLQLSLNDYSLAKAGCEDILNKSESDNWTIIRPYITYNYNRLQLGVYESQDWLYRVLLGKEILFPKEMAQCNTTLTYAKDVALRIALILGDYRWHRETMLPVSREYHTWGDIADIYRKILKTEIGIDMNIRYTNGYGYLVKYFGYDKTICDRMKDRLFDNTETESKLKYTEKYKDYTAVETGLRESIRLFFAKGKIFQKKKNFYWEVASDSLLGLIDCSLDSHLVFWGAGKMFEKIIGQYFEFIHPLFVVDKDEKKWGRFYGGIQCVSPEQLDNLKINKVLIAVENTMASFEIEEYLRYKGIECENICCWLIRKGLM